MARSACCRAHLTIVKQAHAVLPKALHVKLLLLLCFYSLSDVTFNILSRKVMGGVDECDKL